MGFNTTRRQHLTLRHIPSVLTVLKRDYNIGGNSNTYEGLFVQGGNIPTLSS